jgi:hypothetical protein
VVGDAEDRARWERYARLIDGAARLEANARSDKRASKEDALRMMEEAQSLRRYAHALTV